MVERHSFKEFLSGCFLILKQLNSDWKNSIQLTCVGDDYNIENLTSFFQFQTNNDYKNSTSLHLGDKKALYALVSIESETKVIQIARVLNQECMIISRVYEWWNRSWSSWHTHTVK